MTNIVTVKPLVWGDPEINGNTGMVLHQTRGSVVSYTVYDWASVPSWGRDYFECLGEHDTLVSAKAAAQADYERRILSAINVDLMAVAEAVREACVGVIEQGQSERCVVCGHPRNNHPYRHPFTSRTKISDTASAIRNLDLKTILEGME